MGLLTPPPHTHIYLQLHSRTPSELLQRDAFLLISHVPFLPFPFEENIDILTRPVLLKWASGGKILKCHSYTSYKYACGNTCPIKANICNMKAKSCNKVCCRNLPYLDRLLQIFAFMLQIFALFGQVLHFFPFKS